MLCRVAFIYSIGGLPKHPLFRNGWPISFDRSLLESVPLGGTKPAKSPLGGTPLRDPAQDVTVWHAGTPPPQQPKHPRTVEPPGVLGTGRVNGSSGPLPFQGLPRTCLRVDNGVDN